MNYEEIQQYINLVVPPWFFTVGRIVSPGRMTYYCSYGYYLQEVDVLYFPMSRYRLL